MITKHQIAFAVALASLGTMAPALADTYVPRTGSEAGVVVPNARPGQETAHPGQPNGHIVSPIGIVPRTGSESGVQPSNSVPGDRASIGEARPHADVVSPRGVVPRTGSERGAIVPNAR